jgi:hypothetical protein
LQDNLEHPENSVNPVEKLLMESFKFRKFLIPRYIVGAMAPYILIALLMLTAILLAQQAARLAEVVIYADLPFSFLLSIGAALLAGVLVFSPASSSASHAWAATAK